MRTHRDYHEESLLIVSAFVTYLTATNPEAVSWDFLFVYPFVAAVVAYWAVRTVLRRRGVRL